MRILKLLLAGTVSWVGSVAVHAATFRELGFEDRPSYLGMKEIVLTFDDGPDWTHTAKVLDILKKKGVKASFFINGSNWSNLDTEIPMQDLVRRMVKEGHELANHTQHHEHLPWLSDDAIEDEITAVEESVDRIFGGQGPRLTLLRAPHGEPFQNRDDGFARVSSIVARHAVHVGWNIDSMDWNCGAGDGFCVFNNVMSEVDSGKYGIVLLHSVHAQTVAALPRLIDELRDRGFQFRTVEDAVQGRYGKTSEELIRLD